MQLKEVILLAHSYGGGITQAALSLKPEYFRALILLSSIGEVVHNIHKIMVVIAYVFDFFLKLPLTRSVFKQLAIKTCRVLGASGKLIGDANQNHAILESIKRISFRQLSGFVGEIDVPTLYISCQHDKFVQKKVRDTMQQRIADFTIVNLQGKSHFIFKTHKDEVNRHIAEYLKKRKLKKTGLPDTEILSLEGT